LKIELFDISIVLLLYYNQASNKQQAMTSKTSNIKTVFEQTLLKSGQFSNTESIGRDEGMKHLFEQLPELMSQYLEKMEDGTTVSGMTAVDTVMESYYSSLPPMMAIMYQINPLYMTILTSIGDTLKACVTNGKVYFSM
jgi:hypothetical protein